MRIKGASSVTSLKYVSSELENNALRDLNKKNTSFWRIQKALPVILLNSRFYNMLKTNFGSS